MVTWGSSECGGDSSSVAARLSGGVRTLVANSEVFGFAGAFAALKADGSVVTWGALHMGGDAERCGVASLLSNGVKTVFANNTAFAALKVAESGYGAEGS